MKTLTCPECSTTSDLKVIVYGMPSSEIIDDPRYAIGGCVVEWDGPELQCDECGWKGSEFQAEIASRLR